jgi:hypothetical protein
MGSREQALIREFPNGETHLRYLGFQAHQIMKLKASTRRPSGAQLVGTSGSFGFGLLGIKRRYLFLNQIGNKGEPGELKHLSTQRKGHQRDSVSSGERTRTRPVLLLFQLEPDGKPGLSG